MVFARLAGVALIFIGCVSRSLTIPYQPIPGTAGLQCVTSHTMVFQDARSWNRFWLEYCRAFDDKGALLPAPEVDFDQYTLVGIFLGERPSGGYGITIKEIRKTKKELQVFTEERTPKPGDIVTTMLTYPCALVTIEKTGLPLRVITLTKSD